MRNARIHDDIVKYITLRSEALRQEISFRYEQINDYNKTIMKLKEDLSLLNLILKEL